MPTVWRSAISKMIPQCSVIFGLAQRRRADELGTLEARSVELSVGEQQVLRTSFAEDVLPALSHAGNGHAPRPVEMCTM